MTVRDVLTGAKARVERGWCQGAPALDANGRFAFPEDEQACSWCLGGAIRAAGGDSEDNLLALRAVWNAMPETGRPSIPQNLAFWNDARGRTQDQVIAAFDAAIAQAIP